MVLPFQLQILVYFHSKGFRQDRNLFNRNIVYNDEIWIRWEITGIAFALCQ